MKIYLWRKF